MERENEMGSYAAPVEKLKTDRERINEAVIAAMGKVGVNLIPCETELATDIALERIGGIPLSEGDTGEREARNAARSALNIIMRRRQHPINRRKFLQDQYLQES